MKASSITEGLVGPLRHSVRKDLTSTLKRQRSRLSVQVGEVIRRRRRELRLSQEELAWRAGVDRTYVSGVERGARNLSLLTLEKLARALEVSLSTLLRSVELALGTADGPAD